MYVEGTTNRTRTGVKITAVTTNTDFDVCAALLCSTDITATVTDAAGNVVANVPLQKGYNPIQATKVVFASGTIIALYN